MKKSAGAAWEDWEDLIASCPDSEQETAAAAVVGRVQHWPVASARAAAAAARLLPHQQPSQLRVCLPDLVFAPALGELMTAVQRHYTGQLELQLRRSYWYYSACDESLARLQGAKCLLTEFRGCLDGSSGSNSDAVSAIAALLTGEQSLYISQREPLQHHLHQLQCAAGHSLVLRTGFIQAPPTGLPHPRRPLPEGRHPPELTVEHTSSVADAVSTVLTLAPESGSYRKLSLQQTRLEDGALDRLLQQLREEGVRTTNSDGAARWEEASPSGFCCHVCGAGGHNEGQRCINLHLTASGGTAQASTDAPK